MGLRICNNANSGLKLNESLSNGGKYIMEGVFAELGVMNVNHRIYTENEYLKHLQYLREDVKRGDLLGELDHPDDRFEVKVHEASHRIIDIWYEPSTKMVMGKIEILDTPNGKIAKSLVDAGIPLHISSRAAGTINKDNTVSIQQIYTYDIVAKPGFAKATLYRVNESASDKYSDQVMDFLKKTDTHEKSHNALNESTFTDSLNKEASLRTEAVKLIESKSNDINIMALNSHVNEDNTVSAQADTSAESANKAGVPTAPMTLEATDVEDPEKKEGEEKTEETKEKDEKEDKGSDDLYSIKDVELVADEDSDKDSDDEDGDKDKDEKDDESDDKGSEDNDDKEGSKDEKTDECADKDTNGKKEKDATASNKLFDKKEDLGDRQSKFTAKFEELIDNLKKKKNIDEGARNLVLSQYPFSACLNESAFAEFSALTDEQKRKVTGYLKENQVTDVTMINGMWKNGLNENANNEPMWLRRAEPEYRRLYEEASDIEKANLNESAKYLILESDRDIATFWLNSGLKSKRERQLLMESYRQQAPVGYMKQSEAKLPYSMDDVNRMIECYKNR